MALAGVALTSDAVHGAISKDFRKTFGFGAWFTPLVGIYEGTVAALLCGNTVSGNFCGSVRPSSMREMR